MLLEAEQPSRARLRKERREAKIKAGGRSETEQDQFRRWVAFSEVRPTPALICEREKQLTEPAARRCTTPRGNNAATSGR